MKLEILRENLFTLQVCVTKGFSLVDIESEVNRQHLCGTSHGWCVRDIGSCKELNHEQRVQCAKYPENEHIVLDC